MRETEDGGRSELSAFVSPAGAGIAAICFFLPWVRLSCIPKAVSGADLGGIFWVVLIAALAILAVVPFYKSQGRAGDAKPVVVVGALAGLAIIAYRAFQLFGGIDTGFGRISASDLGLQPQIGAYGTIGGLLLALVGAGGLENELERADSSSETIKCPKCAKVYPAAYEWRACEDCGADLNVEGQSTKAPLARTAGPASCPQCGRAIPSTDHGQFCSECGARLTGQS